MATSKRAWKGKNLLEVMLKNKIEDHVPRRVTKGHRPMLEGDALVVQNTESLPQVLKKLAVEGFTAVPVVDGRTYLGFLTMLDLVKYTTNLFWANTEALWTDFFEKRSEFCAVTVGDILVTPNKYVRDPAPPTYGEYSTLHACETMAKHGIHRMVVLRKDDPWACMPKLLVTPVREMMDSATVGTVVTAKENEKAINVFNRMASRGLCGLPIVDTAGQLTGSISVKDLKGAGYNGQKFFRLFSSVKEFKEWTRQDFPKLAPSTHYAGAPVPIQALFVTPRQTFGDVLDLMSDGNIHRVYVCSQGRPIAVITQTDMLRQVVKHCAYLSAFIGPKPAEEDADMAPDPAMSGIRSRTRNISIG